MTNTYAEQFERLKRYYSRFTNINNGKTHNASTPDYDDDIYAFFQNCYHLKDWIKNDSACANWIPAPEQLINQSNDLQLCGDLCNALKHLTLHTARSNQSPEFKGGNINLTITEGLGEISTVDINIKYNISTSSGDIDAYELAKRCMEKWEQYINDNTQNP